MARRILDSQDGSNSHSPRNTRGLSSIIYSIKEALFYQTYFLGLRGMLEIVMGMGHILTSNARVSGRSFHRRCGVGHVNQGMLFPI